MRVAASLVALILFFAMLLGGAAHADPPRDALPSCRQFVADCGTDDWVRQRCAATCASSGLLSNEQPTPSPSSEPSYNSICGHHGCLRDQIRRMGYALVPDVFTAEQTLEFRQRVLDYFDENFEFIGDSLKGFRVTHVWNYGLNLTDMLKHSKAIDVIKAVVPEPMYLHLFEAHVATVLDLWHDDTPHAPWDALCANGTAQRAFADDIEDDPYDVYKLIVYLQDHSNDKWGLGVQPGSHKRNRPMCTIHSTNCSMEPHAHVVHHNALAAYPAVRLQPKLGDVIVIDNRVSHVGDSPNIEHEYWPRMNIQIGFGRRNSVYSNEFTVQSVVRGLQSMMRLWRTDGSITHGLFDANFAGLPLYWYHVPFDARDAMDAANITHGLKEAFDAVLSGLPRFTSLRNNWAENCVNTGKCADDHIENALSNLHNLRDLSEPHD